MLSILDAVETLDSLKIPTSNRLENYKEIERDNIVSESIINIEFVLFGKMEMCMM